MTLRCAHVGDRETEAAAERIGHLLAIAQKRTYPLMKRHEGRAIGRNHYEHVGAQQRRLPAPHNCASERPQFSRCSSAHITITRRPPAGDKALIGNVGYRLYLRWTRQSAAFEITAGKLAEEIRFDGIFVLRSNAGMTPFRAAHGYAIMVVGAVFVIDHVWLVDQRDTLKRASKAAAIAATQAAKQGRPGGEK